MPSQWNGDSPVKKMWLISCQCISNLPQNCTRLECTPVKVVALFACSRVKIIRHNAIHTCDGGMPVSVEILRTRVRGRIQKFPDWPPGTRTANGTALCHLVQLYRYLVSQSSEFCRRDTLCCISTSVCYCCCCCCCWFRYRLSPETFGHTLVRFNLPTSFMGVSN
jgi:hypothetical protein